MPKIIKTTDKKTGQEKYSMILPKEVMDDLAVQAGDSLILKSVVGNEIAFRYKRNES